LQANGTTANQATAAGLTWENNSGTTVNSALTKNLPVSGTPQSY